MVLKIINNKENLRIVIRDELLTKIEAITGNIYTSKLLFFLTLSGQDLVNEDLKGYSFEEILKEEKN